MSLRYSPRVEAASRRQRLLFLRDLFQRMSSLVAPEGGQVRGETILVSRQTCRGVLPLGSFETLRHRLGRNRVRVEPLYDFEAG